MKRHWISLLLTALFFWSGAFAAQGPNETIQKLSEDEKKALLVYGNNVRRSLGPNLTPPRGSITPEIQNARDEIERIVYNLRGDELKKKKIQLVINIYSGTVENAFMGNVSARYKINPERQVIIRTLLGFDTQKKPIFELALTTGILNLFKTEDELAFVINHELAHLFEGHVKERSFKEIPKFWWSAQQLEVVADYESLRGMVGKYELNAARSAMNTILYNPEEKDFWHYVSGLMDHHHEGVRLALIEANIEHIRRTHADAQPMNYTPLSKALQVRNQNRVTVRSLNFAEQKKEALKVLKKYYLAGRDRPEKLHEILTDGMHLGSDQLKDIFWEGWRAIVSSNKSPQIKVDAFLKFGMFVNDDIEQVKRFKASFWNELTDDEVRQITYWLTEMAVNQDGWKASSFFDDSPGHSTKGQSSSFGYLFCNKRLQTTFKKLTDHASEWKNYAILSAGYGFKKTLKDNHNAFDAKNDVTSLIALNDAENKMAPLLKQETLRQLESQDWADIATHKNNEGRYSFLNFMALYKIYDEKYVDETFRTEVLRIIEPGRVVFMEKTVSDILQTLRNPNATPEQKHSAVWALEHIFRQTNLIGEQRRLLIQLIPHLADYFYNTMEAHWNLWLMRYSPIMYSMYAEGLSGDLWSKEEKLRTFRFIVRMNMSGYPRSDGKIPEDIEQGFRKYIATLNAQDIETVSTIDTSPGFKNTLDLLYQEAQNKGELNDFSFISNFRSYVEYWVGQMRGVYSLLGIGGETTQTVLQTIQYSGFKKLVAHYNKAKKKMLETTIEYIPERERWATDLPDISNEGVHFLMSGLFEFQNQIQTLTEWKKLYLEILDIAPLAQQNDASYAQKIENFLMSGFLKNLSDNELYDFLKNKKIRKAFENETLAKMLTRYAAEKILKNRHDLISARSIIVKIEKDYQLVKDAPEVGNEFRNLLLTEIQAQPDELRVLFPKLTDTRSTTQLTTSLATPTRGMSAIVGLTQKESPAEQIKMVEYLMGRSDVVPAFYNEAAKKVKDFPLVSLLKLMKAKLKDASSVERILAVSSFFSGPKGMANDAVKSKELMTTLLQNVSPEKKEVAWIIGESLLEANSEARSLVFAMIYSKKAKAGSSMLSEGEILSALFYGHGVPGIKFAQYLSFTESLKDFSAELADSQDAALPLTTFETLNLLLDHYQGQWPANLEIKNYSLGSGSVNVAIETYNSETKRTEVISILRPNIEIETTENFRKFNKLLEALAKRSSAKYDFRFLRGLSNIIQKSVTLEFNKEAAFEMQKTVEPRYSRTIEGWQIESVTAYQRKGGAIVMAKADGITAKKLFERDTKTYASAMSAMSQLEMDLLLGMTNAGRASPFLAHANPDFHDGQVLIDVPNRKIRILDFGQAVPITNAERILGLELLRICADVETPESTVKLVNGWAKRPLIQTKDLDSIFAKSTDRMDRFVRVISELSLRGYEVPIAAIHWVMAVDRQVSLGNKIGVRNERVFKHLVLTHKLGIGLKAFNQAHLMTRSIEKGFSQLSDFLGTQAAACGNLFKRVKQVF